LANWSRDGCCQGRLQAILWVANHTIDNTHILIFKPFTPYLAYYFYHKMKGYSIVAQVADYKKGFLDVFVGLLTNVNDSRILH